MIGVAHQWVGVLFVFWGGVEYGMIDFMES